MNEPVNQFQIKFQTLILMWFYIELKLFEMSFNLINIIINIILMVKGRFWVLIDIYFIDTFWHAAKVSALNFTSNLLQLKQINQFLFPKKLSGGIEVA